MTFFSHFFVCCNDTTPLLDGPRAKLEHHSFPNDFSSNTFTSCKKPMIARTLFLFFVLSISLTGRALAGNNGVIYPIPEGMARLVVERPDELLLYRQDALILLNGRPVGNLARGARLQLDLAPGTWRLSAQARPTAEHSILPVTLKANAVSQVRVELDPVRFPPERGVSGLGNLMRQSLDAPNDDRLPLFKLREVVIEIPEGDR